MSVDPRGNDLESSVELLARARSGDRDALERLCERHRPALRRWARGRLPPWARDMLDTDDLVQDALLQTIRRMESFVPRHDGALQAYLRQALQNRIREEIRRKRRNPERVPVDGEKEDDAPSPLERAVGKQNLERYEAALERLRPDERELIVLRIEMDFGYEKMAEAIGKPSANAARMAVMRALTRLAEEIRGER